MQSSGSTKIAARRGAQGAFASFPTSADSVGPSERFAAKWLVLHTRSRQEKAVAELLHKTGVTSFLPSVRRIMHYAHRRRTVSIPMFAGYVFVWGTVECTYAAIDSKRVVRAIAVPDQKRLTQELDQIRRAMAGDAKFSPYRFLERGMRVRVTSGPFKDVEGLVDEGVHNNRLILNVQALGRATSLEIDATLLERIREDADECEELT
jgi:transcription antitermination factor NusG